MTTGNSNEPAAETAVQAPASGWHTIARSENVSGEALLSVTFAGKGLVVYRDPDDKAHIASATCPHNAVDLNCTSAPIVDGIIACPLHGWNFDTVTGKCTLVPYNPAFLPDIALKEYGVREEGGEIQLWWD